MPETYSEDQKLERQKWFEGEYYFPLDDQWGRDRYRPPLVLTPESADHLQERDKREGAEKARALGVWDLGFAGDAERLVFSCETAVGVVVVISWMGCLVLNRANRNKWQWWIRGTGKEGLEDTARLAAECGLAAA